MVSIAKKYKKQNSFSGIRHKSSFQSILPRLLKLRDNLATQNLSDYQKGIVNSAVEELLDKKMPEGSHSLPLFELYSYNVDEISKLTDEELPRYLFYRYRYDTFPQRQKLDNFPPCLQIEPTSVCNYRCLFCYQTDKDFSQKNNGFMGTMTLDLFKNLIDQAEGQCEAITMGSRGELMVCQNIEEMLAYVRGKFLALKVNTNASLLDEKKCHALLQADIGTLVFSADAVSEPLYGSLRVGGDLEKVYKNVSLFRDIRAKHYSKSRILTRISGVKYAGTGELDEMESFWGELVDQVAFVNYNPWEKTYTEPVNNIVDPCSELWLRMFVWWDGTVNPCENDYKSTLSVGSTEKETLSKLWCSDRYMELRKQHLAHRRLDCFPCNRCVVT